jgi:N-acetylmuramoyl-L-alanine amidase
LLREDDTPYRFVSSPNVGEQVQHEYLIIHYTAGRSAESSISWLSNRRANASAHVVIGRDGGIAQLVSFDKVAWHAGESHWENREGLNRCSLGVELDNLGKLTRRGDRWLAWFGGECNPAEVLEAVHKHEGVARGWHTYTQEQLEAALELANLLVNHYGLRNVLGHEDISPGRKVDPGPAFPMSSFRAHVLGRKEDAERQYSTTDINGEGLNIRRGPGPEFETIPGSPLPRGTRVHVLSEQGNWRRVEVLEVVNGVMDVEGWVHGRYLVPVD